jgi:tRNA G26 N,N-dimethylase Trm1
MEEIATKRNFRLGRKIDKILTLTKTEAEAPITYYVSDKLCDKLNLPAPAMGEVMKALRNSGFQAYATHFNSKGIRTNASAMQMRELLQRIFDD